MFSQINWKSLLENNWKRLASLMEKRKLDAIVVNGVENVRYLTGYSPPLALYSVQLQAAIFLRTSGRPMLFPTLHVDYIKKKFSWLTEVYSAPVNPSEFGRTIRKILTENGLVGGRIGCDSYVSYSLGKIIEKELPKAQLVDADQVLSNVRAVKNHEEIEVIHTAVAIAEIGMNRAIELSREGMRELEVSAEAEHAMRKAGAEAVAFVPSVLSGENTTLQGITSDKIIRRGDFVLIDLGCLYEGYCAEFARTIVVGEPTSKQEEAYRLVLEAEQKAIGTLRPGIQCSSVDSAAREVIREGGYGEFEHKHATGHGIGMSVWEYPSIDQTTNVKLEHGMIVNIEPGIYRKGLGGIRTEDTILVTDVGNEVLTKTRYWDIE